MKMNIWNRNWTKWTLPLGKSMRLRDWRTRISRWRFNGGKLAPKLLKKAKSRKSKSSRTWWKTRGDPPLIEKSNRWPPDSRMISQLWRMKSENAEISLATRISKSMIGQKDATNWKEVRRKSRDMRICWPNLTAKLQWWLLKSTGWMS